MGIFTLPVLPFFLYSAEPAPTNGLNNKDMRSARLHKARQRAKVLNVNALL